MVARKPTTTDTFWSRTFEASKRWSNFILITSKMKSMFSDFFMVMLGHQINPLVSQSHGNPFSSSSRKSINPPLVLSKSSPKASMSFLVIFTFGSSWIFAGPFSLSKNRHPASSSSLLIFMRAFASLEFDINLFVNHLIVSLVTANPDIILATINPDFLALAVGELFVGIPKNLISAMSAFVVGLFFGFVGDFLWHKFILGVSPATTPRAAPGVLSHHPSVYRASRSR